MCTGTVRPFETHTTTGGCRFFQSVREIVYEESLQHQEGYQGEGSEGFLTRNVLSQFWKDRNREGS